MERDSKPRAEALLKELQDLLAASKAAAPATNEDGLAWARADSKQLGCDRKSQERKSHEQRKSSEQRNGRCSTDRNVSSQANALQPASGGSSSLNVADSWVQQEPVGDTQTETERRSWGRWKCLAGIPFRGIGLALKRHPSIWLTSLLVMLVLTAGGIVGVMQTAATETQQRRMAAQGFAINAAVAFERQLQQMFEPLLALSTIIRFNPDYPVVNKTFDSMAAELLGHMPAPCAITTLIAAPQGVLRNFYPLEGYCLNRCENLTKDLFLDPERRNVALQTVEKRQMMMQGPMTLSQGYFGVVGRLPVFIENSLPNETFGAPALAYNCSICYNKTTKEQFWGFVNAVVNFETLTTGMDSRLKDLESMGYLYQMYDVSPNGSINVIAQTSQVPVNPVTTDVHVPNGDWTLEVSPETGWIPSWRGPVLAAVVLACLLIGLLVGATLVSRRLQLWLATINEVLGQEKERMDVLLARQYNLISCFLEHGGLSGEGKAASFQNRTLERIEKMRQEIGVSTKSGVDELQLLELIDEGTFGKVYKGVWRGTTVAIKSMILPAKMSGAEKRERMAIMEAAISSAMNHPNIVQTYTYTIRTTTGSGVHVSSETSDSHTSFTHGSGQGNLDVPESVAHAVHSFEVSLVLEYCDWGSLRTALDAGAFFAEDNSLNYAAILDTAADVARAMVHLHRHQVLHSDLKVRNVLLKSEPNSRGCTAKIADFGLAVKIEMTDTHISAFQGTMSHMSPEALVHGRISKAGDVYSFGITLWELFTGGHAHQGVPRALLGHKVAELGQRPVFPPFTPARYAALAEACWAADPEQRPSFEEVLQQLQEMRQQLKPGPTPPLIKYKLQTKQVMPQQPEPVGQKSVDAAVAAGAAGLYQMASYYMDTSTSNTAAAAANANGWPAAAHASVLKLTAAAKGGSNGSSSNPGPVLPVNMHGPHPSSIQRLMHKGLIRLQGGSLTWGQLDPIADDGEAEEATESGSARIANATTGWVFADVEKGLGASNGAPAAAPGTSYGSGTAAAVAPGLNGSGRGPPAEGCGASNGCSIAPAGTKTVSGSAAAGLAVG